MSSTCPTNTSAISYLIIKIHADRNLNRSDPIIKEQKNEKKSIPQTLSTDNNRIPDDK